MAITGYTSVKVFSATRHVEREKLGEHVTEWLGANPRLEVVDTQVLQSSDTAYHCHTIILFLKEKSHA